MRVFKILITSYNKTIKLGRIKVNGYKNNDLSKPELNLWDIYDLLHVKQPALFNQFANYYGPLYLSIHSKFDELIIYTYKPPRSEEPAGVVAVTYDDFMSDIESDYNVTVDDFRRY